jgi:hypothetical protein
MGSIVMNGVVTGVADTLSAPDTGNQQVTIIRKKPIIIREIIVLLTSIPKHLLFILNPPE